MLRSLVTAVLIFCGQIASALERDALFDSLDGGTLAIPDWAGQPVLVVNTASRCAFTKQYAELQDLYDRYRDQGLVVMAIPSDNFRQELSSNQEVKDFCELQYGIDLPMTTITTVTGPDAHPFYVSLAAETGIAPAWNFNKVLLGPDGTVIEFYGSAVRPMSQAMRRDIEALLP